jgi:hypothetical protein
MGIGGGDVVDRGLSPPAVGLEVCGCADRLFMTSAGGCRAWVPGLCFWSGSPPVSRIAAHWYLVGIAVLDGTAGGEEREEMEITVLGPLTVDGADILGRRDRVVLAVLASRPGLQVTPDTLADAVWGDAPPASATKNLQGGTVAMRRRMKSTQEDLLSSPRTCLSSHGC